MRDYVAAHDHVNNISLISLSSGDTIVSTDETANNYYSKLWFKSAYRGESQFFTKITNDVNTSYFYIAIPVENNQRVPINCLLMEINWIEIASFLNISEERVDYFNYVLDHSGTVNASRGHWGIGRINLEYLDAGRLATVGKEGVVYEKSLNSALLMNCFYQIEFPRELKSYPMSFLSSHHVLSKNVNYTILEELNRSDHTGVKFLNIFLPNFLDSLSYFRKCLDEIKNIAVNLQKTSEETNMLSVNAGIQASITDSEGESFSVIAEEINKQSELGIIFVKQLSDVTSRLDDYADDIESVLLELCYVNVIKDWASSLRYTENIALLLSKSVSIHKAFSNSQINDDASLILKQFVNDLEPFVMGVSLVGSNGKELGREGVLSMNKDWDYNSRSVEVSAPFICQTTKVNFIEVKFPIIQDEKIYNVITQTNWKRYEEILSNDSFEKLRAAFIDNQGHIIHSSDANVDHGVDDAIKHKEKVQVDLSSEKPLEFEIIIKARNEHKEQKDKKELEVLKAA